MRSGAWKVMHLMNSDHWQLLALGKSSAVASHETPSECVRSAGLPTAPDWKTISENMEEEPVCQNTEEQQSIIIGAHTKSLFTSLYGGCWGGTKVDSDTCFFVKVHFQEFCSDVSSQECQRPEDRASKSFSHVKIHCRNFKPAEFRHLISH